MNSHVSESIKKKWMNYEFLGIPFVLKNGKKYMRAHSKYFQVTHFYDFEKDFMWFSKDDIISK